MKHFLKSLALLIFFTLFSVSKLFALDGAVGSHDPGVLIKEKNKYWMYTTGHGIYAAYSTDLFTWTSGPKTVFPVGTWPAWINEAVPGFDGIFWAPECFYMNGKYYMYYSCSTFGSSRSAIGVAVSPTLDQDSPDYHWTDLGMVVSSLTRSDVNAIDPAIFKDDNGKVYMTYGSFSAGIGIVELDATTGKRKSGAPIVRVAGGNHADWEAPFLFKEGSYYYMVVNRGKCCNGSSSTYKLVMGRSTNVNGPYIDKNGVDLRSNGGTTLLETSGKYIGPGHFGLLRENGVNIVSLHYYDGNDNGNAKLDIANMGYNNGWPFLTRDWLAAGRFKITNQNSKLVWDSKGCTGTAGAPVTQGQWANQSCQQWDLKPVGNGYYEIKNVQSGLLAGLATDPYVDAGVEGSVSTGLTPESTVQPCKADFGSKLQLDNALGTDCQRFKIERTADGSFVLTSAAGDKVVEVPAASSAPGVQLALWSNNGCTCQRWYINAPSTALISKATEPAPANGTTNLNPETVQLSWKGMAQSYNLYLGTSPDNLSLLASGITATSYAVNDLVHQQKYFWRADAVRDGEVATGDIWSFTVADTTPPVVLVKNVTVQLSRGTATIQPSDVDNGSYDTYGIGGMTLSKSSFDCSSIGENKVVLTVTDKNGNAASATAVVTVEGAIPVPAISVTRQDATFTGGDSNTIFLGYGAQSLTLTATDAGSGNNTTYNWSPATYLSSTTSSNPTFAPAVPGTYAYTVTATNANGCTATSQVVLTVIDVRCGNNLDKVQVCHKNESLCIPPSNVEMHLAHGCRLGTCTVSATTTSNSVAATSIAEAANKAQLDAYPNPSSGYMTISASLATGGKYRLEMYSLQGASVKVIESGELKQGEQSRFTLQTATYPAGIYLLKLIGDKETVVKKIVIQK